jgi:hypothetical protein
MFFFYFIFLFRINIDTFDNRYSSRVNHAGMKPKKAYLFRKCLKFVVAVQSSLIMIRTGTRPNVQDDCTVY